MEEDDHRVDAEGRPERHVGEGQEGQDQNEDPGPFLAGEKPQPADDLGQSEEPEERADDDADEPQDGRAESGMSLLFFP